VAAVCSYVELCGAIRVRGVCFLTAFGESEHSAVDARPRRTAGTTAPAATASATARRTSTTASALLVPVEPNLPQWRVEPQWPQREGLPASLCLSSPDRKFCLSRD
jgi:hypothetical protein